MIINRQTDAISAAKQFGAMNRSFLLVVGDFTDAEQRFAKLTLKPFCFGLGGGIDINELLSLTI